MAQKFLNGVKSYFNASNYTLLGYDSLDVVGGDLVLKRAGSEKLRIGANTATFASDVTVNGSHLTLANGTTYAAATDYLYIGGTGLASADAAIYIGNGGGNSTNGYGYRIYYSGTGTGNDNKLILKSENYNSAEIDMLTFTADGKSTFSQDATFAGVTTIGPGTTGSAYDSTTFLHIKGTTRSIVQQSSTDDAYYMFGDAAANNVAWLGYNHSTGGLDLHAETKITLDKNTTVVGSLNAIGAIEVKDSDGSTTLSHVRAMSNTTEGWLSVSNGSNWGFITRGVANDPRIGAWYGGTLKIEGFHSSDGATGSNAIDFAQFQFGNNHFQMNAATSTFAGTVNITSGGNIGLTINHDDFSEGLVIHRNHANNSPSITFKNNDGQQGILFAQESDSNPYWRQGTNATNYKIWHAGNDGSGSGLDADTLDGNNSSDFAPSSVVNQTDFVSAASGGTFSGDISIPDKLIHSGDPNTYLSFSGADNIKLIAGGKNVLHAHDNGNLYLYGNNGTALTLDGSQNATFAGTITTSDNSSDNYIAATFSDSSYTRIHGYGLYMSRDNSYIRPTTDTGKTLYIGSADKRWDNVNVHATNATFSGNVKVKNALIDNASVTSATTTTVVASISGSTYAAVFFDYVAYKSSNIRAGIVTACSDGTNVSFSETSTTDLGDTSDVTLSVDISGGNFRLLATTASSTWNIKSLIRAI